MLVSAASLLSLPATLLVFILSSFPTATTTTASTINPFLLRRQEPLAVSTNGSCAGDTGLTCQGSEFGDCCSQKGFCGSDSAYCGGGCQRDFGTCTTASTSSDGSCGGTAGTTCPGSVFGDCCSARGFCGDGSSYCGAGCQTEFGTCNDQSVSSDGSCGGPKKVTCQGSDYGNCCSKLGFCGSNSSYCAAGCQEEFGTCFTADTSDDQVISSDGSCGGFGNITCQGSDFGNCCSAKGNCGTDSSYCGAGCQKQFGTCLPGSDDAESGSLSSTSTPDAGSGSGGGGMSKGAIAGAAVGSISGVVLLAVVGFLLWRRRKASSLGRTIATQSITSPAVDEKKEFYEPPAPPKQAPVYELGTPISELPAESTSQELPDSSVGERHEGHEKHIAARGNGI